MKAVVIYIHEKGNGEKETVTEYYTLVQQVIDVGRMSYLWLNDKNILNPKTFRTKSEARADLFSNYNNSHLIKIIFEDKESE
jgi:hypothetical protein